MKQTIGIFIFHLLGILSINNAVAQKSVTIGNQKWMTKNLDVSRFRNGDIIPQAQTNEEWEKAGFGGKPAWCYYNFEGPEQKGHPKQYGKMYNLYTIKDPRGIAPEGWHIPTDEEWKTLEATIDEMGFGVIDLLSKNSWKDLKNGTNKLGLNIFLAGWRDVGCGGYGENTNYWCQHQGEGDNTSYVNVNFFEDQPSIVHSSTTWIMGYYVRCIKD